MDHDAPVLGNPAAMYYLRNVAKIEVASDGVLAFTKDCDTKICGRSIRAFVMQDAKWKSARRVSGDQNSFLRSNFNYPRPTAMEDAAFLAWLAAVVEGTDETI
jgi:hypothetical protein